MRKLFDNIRSAFSLRPAALTATTNGTSVDTRGYGDAMAVLEVGAVSGTSPTLDVKIQESDDNSAFTDVAGAAFTQVTAANSSQVLRLGQLNLVRKRYVRAVATIGGTSPSFALGCQILLGEGASGAVNND